MDASPEALYAALGEHHGAAEALLAVRELTRTGWYERLSGGPVDVSDRALGSFLICELQNPREERLYAIFLDVERQLIRAEMLGAGSRDSLSLRQRPLLQRALELGARALIVAHNHPSGSALPSEKDRRATAELERTARSLDVELVDHCIVARGQVYSMRKEMIL